MRTPTTIKGHPLHPLLITLPIGMFVFSLISDLIYAAGWGSSLWRSVAFYNLGGGIISALIAAIPGAIDLFSLSDSNVKRTGVLHMAMMLLSVAVFAVDFWLRLGGRDYGRLPLALS